ncbi:hypothetical protein ACI2KG_28470 [Pseudomonas sp. NPDC089407]|uniref:hypothetical protein n=1 Tax=Pseudomonas sp. NPDC089407 TaxID=3364464 RepID=UPI00384E1F9C
MTNEYYKVQKKDAEKTIVVFSSIHTTPGRFRFERQLADVNVNAIFLNCPNNSWYLQGVPGLGDSLSATRDALKQLIKSTFPDSKIYALGSSMGASGLIALTAGLDIENSFAFCPEIDLFGKYSFSSNYYKGPVTAHRNLWSELADSKNLNIFYGEECESDLNQLCSIKTDTSIPVLTFAHEGHGTIEAIFLSEGMNGLLDSLLNGRPMIPKVIERGHAAGSLVTCKTLWKSYWISKNKSKDALTQNQIKEALESLALKTATDRSYYALIQYWRAQLSNSKDEKKILLENALESAPHSLRTASAYFKLFGTDQMKNEFKERFRLRYGNRYTDHARAEPIRKF